MTPFSGLRVLTRSGQGLLGQSEELDKLMAKILGDEIKKGRATKIQDDIIIGSSTKLRQNLRETLSGESKSRTREDDNLSKVSRYIRMDLGEGWIHQSISTQKKLLDQHQRRGHKDGQGHEELYQPVQNSSYSYTSHGLVCYPPRRYGARSSIQRQVRVEPRSDTEI